MQKKLQFLNSNSATSKSQNLNVNSFQYKQKISFKNKTNSSNSNQIEQHQRVKVQSVSQQQSYHFQNKKEHKSQVRNQNSQNNINDKTRTKKEKESNVKKDMQIGSQNMQKILNSLQNEHKNSHQNDPYKNKKNLKTKNNKFIDLSKGPLGVIQNFDKTGKIQELNKSVKQNQEGNRSLKQSNKIIANINNQQESQSYMNISMNNLIQQNQCQKKGKQKSNEQNKKFNEELENKINGLMRNAKKLDQKVLKSLDEIFNELIEKDSCFGTSVEKLKQFISQVLQSVLDKLIGQQEGLQQLEKEKNKLKEQNQVYQKQLKDKIVTDQNSESTQLSHIQLKKMNQKQEQFELMRKENKQLKMNLDECQNDLIYLKEKETKLIKLLLAVKNQGVDLESIFQKTILNKPMSVKKQKPKKKFRQNQDESNNVSGSENLNLTIDYFNRRNYSQQANIKSPVQQQNGSIMADISILNDSDESSYNFIGKEMVTDISSDLNINIQKQQQP